MKKISKLSSFITARTLVLALFIFSMNVFLVSQQNGNRRADETPSAPAASPASAATPASENVPLTFRQRFTIYRRSTFAPLALLSPAVGAGFDQLTNSPPEWKQGGEGFGKRLLSGYGSLVVDNTISFGVAALDHEDLRYVRSNYPKKAFFRRAGYAVTHTFVSRLDNGGHTLAWSRLAGAYGAGFVANTWYPERHSNLHNAVSLGTFNFATGVGYNLFKEFIHPHFFFGGEKNKTASRQ